MPASEIKASGSITSDGNSSTITANPKLGKIVLWVDVTAVTGTSATLDLAVEWSPDGTDWASHETAQSFTQLVQAGGAQTVLKDFDAHADYYRVTWTLGGTSPDWTFSVSELT